MKKMKVGVIGTGAISNAYFNHMKNYPVLDVVACADLNMDAAREKAEKHEVPLVLEVDE